MKISVPPSSWSMYNSGYLSLNAKNQNRNVLAYIMLKIEVSLYRALNYFVNFSGFLNWKYDYVITHRTCVSTLVFCERDFIWTTKLNSHSCWNWHFFTKNEFTSFDMTFLCRGTRQQCNVLLWYFTSKFFLC